MNHRFHRIVVFGMLAVTLAIPSLASALCRGVDPGKWATLSSESFELVKENERPIFLFVYKRWDYWCQKLNNEVLDHKEFRPFLEDQCIPVLVDAEMRPTLAEEYLMGGWPTCLLLTETGAIIDAIPGYQDRDTMSQFITEGYEKYKKWQRRYRKPVEPPTRKPIEGFEWDKAKGSMAKAYQRYVRKFNERLEFAYDKEFSGFGRGMKFPHPLTLRYSDSVLQTTDAEGWETMTENSLAAIVQHLGQQKEPFLRYAGERDWSSPAAEWILTDTLWLLEPLLPRLAEGQPLSHHMTPFDLRLAIETKFSSELNLIQEVGWSDVGAKKMKEFGDSASLGMLPRETNFYAATQAKSLIALIRAAKLNGDPQYGEWAHRLASGIREHFLSPHGMFHAVEVGSGKALPFSGLTADNAWALLAFTEYADWANDASYHATIRTLASYVLDSLFDANIEAFVVRNSLNEKAYPPNAAFSQRTSFEENGVLAEAFAKAGKLLNEQEYLTIAEGLCARFPRPMALFLDECIPFLNAFEVLNGGRIEEVGQPLSFQNAFRYGSLMVLGALIGSMFMIAAYGGMTAAIKRKKMKQQMELMAAQQAQQSGDDV